MQLLILISLDCWDSAVASLTAQWS